MLISILIIFIIALFIIFLMGFVLTAYTLNMLYRKEESNL